MNIPACFTLEEGMRLMPVENDTMEPTLRSGDAVGVVPVDRFRGEGVYVIESGGFPLIFRCRHERNGRIFLWRDNKRYSTLDLSLEEFNDCILAEVHLVCRWLVTPSAANVREGV